LRERNETRYSSISVVETIETLNLIPMKPQRHILAWTIAIALPGSLAKAADLDLPPLLQQKLEVVTVTATDRSLLLRNFAAFGDALKDVGASLTPAIVKAAKDKEGDDMNAKLIVLAHAYSQDRAPFDELYKYYVTDGLKNSRAERGETSQFLSKVYSAPTIRPEHATERFRLAWEFYMFHSVILGTPRENFSKRVEQALVQIGNPRSIQTIAFRFNQAAGDSRTEAAHFIRLLLQFPSKAAVPALLDCLRVWDARAEDRKGGGGSPPIPGLLPIPGSAAPEIPDIRAYTGDVFAEFAKEFPEKGTQWVSFLNDYSSTELKPAELQFLKAMRDAQK
jgi:hypothetical protein